MSVKAGQAHTKQTFTPAGGQAILATGKSVSGVLALIGGAIAAIQMLIAAAVVILH
jgi:hypothetical protein